MTLGEAMLIELVKAGIGQKEAEAAINVVEGKDNIIPSGKEKQYATDMRFAIYQRYGRLEEIGF